jgi:hypothetical protein
MLETCRWRAVIPDFIRHRPLAIARASSYTMSSIDRENVMMYRLALTLLVPVIVSACAGGPGYGPGYRGAYEPRPPMTIGPSGDPPASPLARSASYTCEDLTTIVLTEGQPTAQVTMNSGLVVNLARQPDSLGLRYGAPPTEFRVRGGEATFVSGNRFARCRAK